MRMLSFRFAKLFKNILDIMILRLFLSPYREAQNPFLCQKSQLFRIFRRTYGIRIQEFVKNFQFLKKKMKNMEILGWNRGKKTKNMPKKLNS